MNHFLTTTLIIILTIIGNAYADGLPSKINTQECVILLHGLGRTSKSMAKIESTLKKKGYSVKNISYPSRKYTIETLVNNYITPAVSLNYNAKKIHFVTHSLGGILVRYYLEKNPLSNLGEVVMFAPPNKGSEVVDTLGNFYPAKWWFGPAFLQLSTAETSIPNQLEIPTYSIGILAGTKSINPFLSYLIPGENDGKVSVKSTGIQGQTVKKINASHTWITKNSNAINNMVYFLEHGKFIN
jgi:triacylglycerol lipase